MWSPRTAHPHATPPAPVPPHESHVSRDTVAHDTDTPVPAPVPVPVRFRFRYRYRYTGHRSPDSTGAPGAGTRTPARRVESVFGL